MKEMKMSTTPSPLPSPERAVIGFFLYVTSIFSFVVYLFWAYLPNTWLENIAITYYPNKYWSIAIAAFIFALLLAIILGNFVINQLSVPSLNSMKLISDRHTRKLDYYYDSDNDVIPPVTDLDLDFVNRALYSANCE